MIQQRFRRQLKLRQAKQTAFLLHWDKTISSLVKNIGNLKSSRSSKNSNFNQLVELLIKMRGIQKPLKLKIAKAFIRRCSLIYEIAFAQWRMFFRSNGVRHDMLQELIDSKLKILKTTSGEIKKQYKLEIEAQAKPFYKQNPLT